LLNDRRHSKSGRLRPRCSSRYLYIYFSRKPTWLDAFCIWVRCNGLYNEWPQE
jgi:hypothetical protein